MCIDCIDCIDVDFIILWLWQSGKSPEAGCTGCVHHHRAMKISPLDIFTKAAQVPSSGVFETCVLLDGGWLDDGWWDMFKCLT